MREKNKFQELWVLFWTFAKMGVMTFGGGMAMLPILQREVVDSKHWATDEELTDYYAFGQCTPVIIAVNTATFVGYRRQGIPGGIFATLGMVSPSLVIITMVASFLQALMDNVYFQHAMMGIKGVVCALMLNTVITLAKKSLVNPICIVICIAAFLLAFFTPVPTIAIVVLAGICGVILDKMGGTVK